MAGYHDLLSTVQVRRRHDFALSCLDTDLYNSVGRQTKKRRHRPDSYRYSLLHKAAAFTDYPERVGHGQGSSRDQGGILSQTVTGDVRGTQAGLLFEHS